MPATIPAAPTNFYSAGVSNSSCCLTPVGGEGCTNFFFRFRAGYEHINHGDNNDTYALGAKFYSYGDGLRFRADFTWPWIHWTTRMFACTDSVCPFCQPLALGLGPTVNVGFDHLYNESKYRLARYAGVRLTFNRAGFIEYTAGGTDGLDGTRQQVVAEIPFYESRDGEVRYYLRGLWNRGAHSRSSPKFLSTKAAMAK